MAQITKKSDRLRIGVEDCENPLRVLEPITDWFAAQGWKPFAFQVAVWEAYLSGRSGLVHVPTGAGKTYAAFVGPLVELIDEARRGELAVGLRVLYVTPLRAVARDRAAGAWAGCA